MQLADLKRPRFFIPIGLLLVLATLSAVVFNPGFQKKMLLKHVGPLVDSLQLEYVHLTPWSLQLNKLAVDYAGGHFSLEQGTLRYCLSSLLLLNANIKTLALQDVSIDVSEFNPPATETAESSGIFPGVLASLQHGLGYSLQQVDINAEVRLPGQKSLTAVVSGGGIRPKTTGTINTKVNYYTGKEGERIAVDSDLVFNQLSRGRFNAIETLLAIEATLANLPEPESASVKLRVTPAPLTEAEQASLQASEEERPVMPEALQLAVNQNDAEGMQRSSLTLDGHYDGNRGVFQGSYRATTNERLVQRYVKDKTIAPYKEEVSGDLHFNIADTTGDITLISELLMKQIRETHASEKLPETLRLENNFRLSLLPGKRLRVETIYSGLTDAASIRPLASSLPEDLDIPLDDVAAFMRQENTLLAFELPEVPMVWFDMFVPEHELVAGTLTGAFEITTDTAGYIHVKPVKPLTVTGLTLQQEDKPVLENFNLKVLPRVTYRGEAVDISLQDLVVDAGEGTVATADFTSTLPLGEQAGAINAQASADLNLHRLVDLLAIEQSGRQSLPKNVSLDFQTAIQQKPDSVLVNALDANLLLDKKTRLLHLDLLRPLLIQHTAAGSRIGNGEGPLATLNISDIQLGWFSAFLPDTTLKGKLQRADFTLAAEGQGVATLVSGKPVRLDNVTITAADGALLKDVAVSVRPSIRLAPDGTRITYEDLTVAGQNKRLLAGSGALTFPGEADTPLRAEGQVDMDVQALSLQPVVARALQGSIEAPLRLEANYKLAQGASSIDLSRLSANLFYADNQPRISLQADSNVRVRTQLGRRQSELGRARGKVTLTVANLTPEPFAGILAANGLSFTDANGRAVLSSDGKSVTIETTEPFQVTGAAVASNGKPALNPFTLTAESETILQDDTLHAKVKQFRIAFDKDKGASAIDANADLLLKGEGDASWVENLTANVNMLLPAVLDQPAVLPGHGLTAGKLSSVTTLDSGGQLDSTTRVEGLKSGKALPLELLEIKLAGQVDADGNFDITAPISTRGKSGESDLQVKAVHAQKQGEPAELTASVDSSVFYLNDILNTLKAIANEEAAAEADAALSEEQQAAIKAERKAREKLPDERAFWDVVPYNRHVTYNIQRLFYTDYLEIVDITGRAEASAARFSLDQFKARFHDSPITLNSVLTFTPGEKPYDLELQAAVDQFDLATFLRELDPESIPVAEGLFDVNIDAYGHSQNMAQYRNNLFFDIRMGSRDGIFRLLDPNDPLVTGSSNLAGVVGEGVSYIPTGLFGLGAVSRMVNYIKEVPYDSIDTHLVRDESRNVQIRRYVVQSPEVLLTAKGGIQYEEGVDVINSPLEMDARLNLRERGAAIFYDLGLLQKEQDRFGYWKGPEIKFWGTPSVMQSNLGEIIETAGKGAILGGITRPISGLIGNVKHLWMDEEGEAIEYTDTPSTPVPDSATTTPADTPADRPKEKPADSLRWYQQAPLE
ncbi:MAG: hypothetical protein LJE75_11595 [Gammaproteobacteria bacterium]|nr:hypothetical protein [Gammaproteobacteria bacterium]